MALLLLLFYSIIIILLLLYSIISIIMVLGVRGVGRPREGDDGYHVRCTCWARRPPEVVGSGGGRWGNIVAQVAPHNCSQNPTRGHFYMIIIM